MDKTQSHIDIQLKTLNLLKEELALTANKVEKMKREGKVWIRIFPDVPVTKKPAEVRMGKGKGSPEFWVCRVKPGRILFEIEGLDKKEAEATFKLCSHKLPIKTKTVGRREVGV